MKVKKVFVISVLCLALLLSLVVSAMAVTLNVRVNNLTTTGYGSKIEVCCNNWGYQWQTINPSIIQAWFGGLPTRQWVWVRATYWDGRQQVQWFYTGSWPYGTMYCNFRFD